MASTSSPSSTLQDTKAMTQNRYQEKDALNGQILDSTDTLDQQHEAWTALKDWLQTEHIQVLQIHMLLRTEE